MITAFGATERNLASQRLPTKRLLNPPLHAVLIDQLITYIHTTGTLHMYRLQTINIDYTKTGRFNRIHRFFYTSIFSAKRSCLLPDESGRPPNCVHLLIKISNDNEVD